MQQGAASAAQFITGHKDLVKQPGRVAQSVRHLTRKSEVLGLIPVWPHTFVSPSADSRGAVVSYWRKYLHEILVNHLGGLGLPRKSVVRLTDRPDMTLDVYRGRKTTTQQQQLSQRKVSIFASLISNFQNFTAAGVNRCLTAVKRLSVLNYCEIIISDSLGSLDSFRDF